MYGHSDIHDSRMTKCKRLVVDYDRMQLEVAGALEPLRCFQLAYFPTQPKVNARVDSLVWESFHTDISSELRLTGLLSSCS